MSTMEQETIVVDDGGLAAIGRHWGVLLFLGIVSIVIGLIAVIWPQATVVVVAFLLAIWLIVSGIFEFIRGFSKGLSGGLRALLIITGVLSVILGILAFFSVFKAVTILAIFLGIAFLFRGFTSLFLSAEVKEGRGWNIFTGIVFLIGGFVVLVWPLGTLTALAWVIGIWLVVGGIFWIVAAFQVRSAAKKALA